jgi:hypothetical protein
MLSPVAVVPSFADEGGAGRRRGATAPARPASPSAHDPVERRVLEDSTLRSPRRIRRIVTGAGRTSPLASRAKGPGRPRRRVAQSSRSTDARVPSERAIASSMTAVDSAV